MSRLEHLLGSMPESIEWPEPPPHMAARVRAQIEAQEKRSWSVRWVWATAMVAVVVAIALIPATRQAVADLIVEAGVRIGVTEETTTDLGVGLDLGEQVSAEHAANVAGFSISVPAELDSPSSVFLDGDRVSMVWRGSGALPAAADSDVGVLLTQASSGGERAVKGLEPNTTLDFVTIDGRRATWIEGAPHEFTIISPEGGPIEETTRLAANVLLWTDDGVDYRLELTGDMEQAISIAESLVEVSP